MLALVCQSSPGYFPLIDHLVNTVSASLQVSPQYISLALAIVGAQDDNAGSGDSTLLRMLQASAASGTVHVSVSGVAVETSTATQALTTTDFGGGMTLQAVQADRSGGAAVCSPLDMRVVIVVVRIVVMSC